MEATTETDQYAWLDYDPEAGDVVEQPAPTDAWRAVDARDVDHALSIRAAIESRLAAVRARKAAYLANMAALEAEQVRKLNWWDWRFRDDVVSFARQSLEGGKGRTARFDHGAVKFRTSAGTNEILDMQEAVALVGSVDPAAVKVERSVTVKAVLAAVAARPDHPAGRILRSTGPRESASIDTGVPD